MALQYFITQEWKFINDKTANLENMLAPSDQQNFTYGRSGINPYEYFKNAMLGGRQYLLKEDISTMPQARLHTRR